MAVYPLETIRTRQALGLRGNFVQAMAGVARDEGVPALYKARAGWEGRLLSKPATVAHGWY